MEPGRRGGRHRTGPSRERRPLAGDRSLGTGRHHPDGQDAARRRPARLGRPGQRQVTGTGLEGPGHRCRLECLGHDQRHPPRRQDRTREVGAVVTFVDAVHYAPHRLVDVRAMGCDFLGLFEPTSSTARMSGILFGSGGVAEARSTCPSCGRAPDFRAGSARNGHAEPRRDRRDRGGHRFPGLARRPGPDRRSRLEWRPSMHCTSGPPLLVEQALGRAWRPSIGGVTLFGPRADANLEDSDGLVLAGPWDDGRSTSAAILADSRHLRVPRRLLRDDGRRSSLSHGPPRAWSASVAPAIRRWTRSSDCSRPWKNYRDPAIPGL